eukprot:m.2252 g.2252  ORF g.2252 m.2252 type:complete len:66 (+) comp2743_c1_seq1:3-200(+)
MYSLSFARFDHNLCASRDWDVLERKRNGFALRSVLHLRCINGLPHQASALLSSWLVFILFLFILL